MSLDVTNVLYTHLVSTMLHVLGSSRKGNIQVPCPKISVRAKEIAKTKEVVDDEAEPINYRPVDQIIAKGLNDIEQDAVDLGDDEHEEDISSDEHEELDLTNDEYEDDVQSMLKANDQALADAIRTLKKARADIKKRLK
ncbi:hypothetical protein BG000_003237 [Podila horticola]|nr:hypothetical protein BG000_003237 [Podila horticola]